MKSGIVKIVVFVPESSADDMRKAMGEAGAGKIGNYTFCSFSTKGTGRFIPGDSTNPAIGKAGIPEEIQEEKIEAICERERLQDVIDAIKRTHPYEEVALDAYPLESL